MSYRDTQNPGIGGLDELTSAEEAFLTSFAGLTFNEGEILKIVSGAPAWAVGGGGGGSGDVVGPASSTDNAAARFDLATGKLLQNSSTILSDSGDITTGNASGNRFIYLEAGNTRRGKITQEGTGAASPLRISSNGALQLEVDDVAVMTIADTGPVTFAQAVTFTSTIGASNFSGTSSGTNTGDNATNTQYSGLVSNATHTGDATGATALTVVRLNGTSLAGLATGILKNTTGTGVPSIAVNSDLPVMTATVGGAVPTPPNNTTTFLRGDGTFSVPAGGGSGDVVGPASAVNNRVAFFDGATGKLIKDSGLTLSGSNTGDQTSIAGLTGTKAQFDTAVTDGNFMYTGDAPTTHTHLLASITDVTPTVTELNFVDGVTSAIQTQIDTKVTGPASATDNGIVRYDGTTGKIVQNANTVVIDDNGRIGIGIAVPLELLHVNSTGDYATMRFDAGSGTTGGYFFADNLSSTVNMGSRTTTDVRFLHGGAEKLKVTSTGVEITGTLSTTGKVTATGGLKILNASTTGHVWTATDTVGNGSWQASAGGGAATVKGQATVDFGIATTENSIGIVTVATASALTASIITVCASGAVTADHDTADYQWDNISGYVSNIVNGVSFDIIGVAPNGTWGDYIFNYVIN